MKTKTRLIKDFIAQPLRVVVWSVAIGGLLFSIYWYQECPKWSGLCTFINGLGPKEHESFSGHLLAVFLEFCLVLFLIEIVWRAYERDHERQERRQQLRAIKWYMFQGHMFGLFKINFGALKTPQIRFSEIKRLGEKGKLSSYRSSLEKDGELSVKYIEYRDVSSKARVFLEYIKAEETVWKRFVELAVLFNFYEVVEQMAKIQGCIGRAKSRILEDPSTPRDPNQWKEEHVASLLENGEMADHIHVLLASGIYKFLLYAEELTEGEFKNLDEFALLMDPYIVSEKRSRPDGTNNRT